MLIPTQPPPRPPLFPYTTLFRSRHTAARDEPQVLRVELERRDVAEVRTQVRRRDRKSTRLNSSHLGISYAVFCLKKKRHLTGSHDMQICVDGRMGNIRFAPHLIR